jgi:hypothetical protein
MVGTEEMEMQCLLNALRAKWNYPMSGVTRFGYPASSPMFTALHRFTPEWQWDRHTRAMYRQKIIQDMRHYNG